LHVFIGVGKAAVCEVEVAGLFDQALEFDGAASIAGLFAKRSESRFDGLAVLACPLLP
jgi:hypothetical protein